MYSTIKEFTADWKYESGSTLKVLKALNDKSLCQQVTADGRSLGFLAWHIVCTLGEMGKEMKLPVAAPAYDAEMPASAVEIAATYEAAAASVAETVRKNWKDGMLPRKITMYGEKWTRAQSLSALIRHEVHHRAQMTVLMRQAGLKVPGVYGPAKEEWAHLGMPAPK